MTNSLACYSRPHDNIALVNTLLTAGWADLEYVREVLTALVTASAQLVTLYLSSPVASTPDGFGHWPTSI